MNHWHEGNREKIYTLFVDEFGDSIDNTVVLKWMGSDYPTNDNPCLFAVLVALKQCGISKIWFIRETVLYGDI